MAYVKKIWIEGDDVTPVEMNNIEDGIETVDLSLTAHKADYAKVNLRKLMGVRYNG